MKSPVAKGKKIVLKWLERINRRLVRSKCKKRKENKAHERKLKRGVQTEKGCTARKGKGSR